MVQNYGTKWMMIMTKTGKKKINPLVKYTNTLRCREFVISWSDLITALNLPQEHIVDIYDEYPNVHIVTDTTIVEKNVK